MEVTGVLEQKSKKKGQINPEGEAILNLGVIGRRGGKKV